MASFSACNLAVMVVTLLAVKFADGLEVATKPTTARQPATVAA